MSIQICNVIPLNHKFEQSQSIVDSRAKNIKVEFITTTSQFNDLENEWNDLLNESASNSIFLTWEWVSTWWKYFHYNTRLWIMTTRDLETNQLTGIAPLATKEAYNLAGFNEKSLIFIGNGFAAPDHLDFIIRKGYENIISYQFANKIWEERYQWNQITIDGLVATSPIIYQILQQHPHLLKKVNRTICPYIPLPDDWETYRSTLSKNMRYSLGRNQRRLEKDYPDVINFKKVEQSDEINDFMNVLVNLHTSSQSRKNNSGLFSNQNMIDFHAELAEVFIKKGWLRSYTLDVGKTSIAALHCFQYNGTVSFYQSGFDQFWQRYSPGIQIMAHAIQEAIKEKNSTFDFLRGDEAYKYKWTISSKTNLVYFVPLSFQNQLGLHLKQFIRKFKS